MSLNFDDLVGCKISKAESFFDYYESEVTYWADVLVIDFQEGFSYVFYNVAAGSIVWDDVKGTPLTSVYLEGDELFFKFEGGAVISICMEPTAIRFIRENFQILSKLQALQKCVYNSLSEAEELSNKYKLEFVIKSKNYNIHNYIGSIGRYQRPWNPS